MVSRLAVRHGFRPREVEDLRLAADEAIIVLLGGRATPAAEGPLTIRTRLDDPTFEVEVSAPKAEPLDDDALARFRELVDDLVDAVDVDAEARTVRFRRDRR